MFERIHVWHYLRRNVSLFCILFFNVSLLYFSLEEEDSLNRQDVTVDNQNNVEGQGKAFIYIFSLGKSVLWIRIQNDLKGWTRIETESFRIQYFVVRCGQIWHWLRYSFLHKKQLSCPILCSRHFLHRNVSDLRLDPDPELLGRWDPVPRNKIFRIRSSA